MWETHFLQMLWPHGRDTGSTNLLKQEGQVRHSSSYCPGSISQKLQQKRKEKKSKKKVIKIKNWKKIHSKKLLFLKYAFLLWKIINVFPNRCFSSLFQKLIHFHICVDLNNFSLYWISLKLNQKCLYIKLYDFVINSFTNPVFLFSKF